MQNDEGVLVDLYKPRKCSATNRLITSKDHASVQINIAHVNDKGVMNRETTAFAICGYLRRKGEADAALNVLAQEAGFLKNVVTSSTLE